jgi:hypothetical protein
MSDTLLPAPVPSQDVYMNELNPVKITGAQKLPEAVSAGVSPLQEPILISQPSQSVETVQNEEQMHEDAIEFLKRLLCST